MAPRFDPNGNIVYTRKQNDAEDIFVHPGDANTARRAGDQTRPQWVGSSVVYFTSERGGDIWDVAISSSAGSSKTLAKDIRLPFRAI